MMFNIAGLSLVQCNDKMCFLLGFIKIKTTRVLMKEKVVNLHFLFGFVVNNKHEYMVSIQIVKISCEVLMINTLHIHYILKI